MESSTCLQCGTTKAHLTCGICMSSICKKCAQFADEESVAFLEEKPKFLAHGSFCQECFDSKVSPELEAYNETLAKAEQVNIFYKTQSKESRFIRRIEKPLRVEECVDRDQTVMKLAFKAATLGFNIVVDVDTLAEKVHIDSYQTSKWKGSGIPANVDEVKLQRRFIGAPN